ncbi:Cu/Zn-superoxide dismutase, partial [Coprinopsis marcescibilis]
EAIVHFTQETEESPVKIKGEIIGLDFAGDSRRGWSIHTGGGLSIGCDSTGDHFNPDGFRGHHGAPESTDRHVGDLGNLEIDANGDAYVDTEDYLISLSGVRSIIGRTLVIHENEDDLGHGNEMSHLDGNVGKGLACGVIGTLFYLLS